MAKLFIVAGHGAGDPGAGGYGYSEAERVRALAAEMKNLGGDQVILGDTSTNWYASRSFQYLSDPGCPIIELHMDSASASACGAHVIIASGLSADAQDEALGNWCAMFFPGRSQHVVARSDLRNPNLCKQRGLNYRLLECGFISNWNDLEKFNSNITTIAGDILRIFGVNAGYSPEVPVPEQDPVELPPAPLTSDKIHRLYNPQTGEHLYTEDQTEIDVLCEENGWTDEGVRWESVPVAPVYRLYNKISGQHLFTADYNEAKTLCEQRDWVFEKIAWYGVSGTSETFETLPVYRLYSDYSATHLLTESDNERAELTVNGSWKDEGLAFTAKAVLE